MKKWIRKWLISKIKLEWKKDEKEFAPVISVYFWGKLISQCFWLYDRFRFEIKEVKE